MFEIKVIVDAPELSAALNNLAAAINNSTGAINAAKAITDVTVSGVVDAAVPTEAVQPVASTEAVAQPVAEPTQPEKVYTLDDLSRAGAELIDQGKMPKLLDLLARYNVQALTQLDPRTYADVAEELKALGAKL